MVSTAMRYKLALFPNSLLAKVAGVVEVVKFGLN